MPSTGTPSSSSSRRSGGAPRSYTEAGPPDRITPRGRRRRTSATPTSWGKSSENTPHSRTLRAISCEYWPPKSRTTTSSGATWRAETESPEDAASAACSARERARTLGDEEFADAKSVEGTDRRRFAASPHPHALLALELLALGLQRRRDRQLRPVELGDVAIAAGGHRGAQRAHQVERAVVLPR